VFLERLGNKVDERHGHKEQYQSTLKLLRLDDFKDKQNSTSPKIHETQDLENITNSLVIERIVVNVKVGNGDSPDLG
jgi:hypothetical protein